MTKKINNKRVCELLNEMEKDESKAKQEYNELINLVKKQSPEHAKELENILNDEISHKVELTKIIKKLKCK